MSRHFIFMTLKLKPITSRYLIDGVEQHRIHVSVDLVRQVWRRMLRQPLYYSSGNAVLSENGAESLSQIMEFEIRQSKLFTNLCPSVLAERAAKQPILPRVHVCSVFLKLGHDWNRKRS